MFDMDGDALDGLDMGQLEALAAQMRDSVVRHGSLSEKSTKKLGSVRKRGIRHGFGVEEVGNINETVDVVVSLPLYMVVGMQTLGEEGAVYREAVRDYLVKRGKGEWSESRFLSSMRGDMQAAKDRFTRNVGLE